MEPFGTRRGPAIAVMNVRAGKRFNDCATLTLAPSQAAQALEQIESIEKLKSIRELTRTLTAASASRRSGRDRHATRPGFTDWDPAFGNGPIANGLANRVRRREDF